MVKGEWHLVYADPAVPPDPGNGQKLTQVSTNAAPSHKTSNLILEK
jgi:hypothetical protein